MALTPEEENELASLKQAALSLPDDDTSPVLSGQGTTSTTSPNNDDPWYSGLWDEAKQGASQSLRDPIPGSDPMTMAANYGQKIGNNVLDNGPVAAIKGVASDALETGGGIAASAAMAATAPETAFTSALLVPGAFTAGQEGGRQVSQAMGLSESDPSIDSPLGITKRLLLNTAVPAAMGTVDRVRNMGAFGAIKPWGETTGGIDGRNAAAASVEQANSRVRSPGVFLTTKEGLGQTGGRTGSIQSINEADQGVIETGLYGGGKQFELNPNSPDFGKFIPGQDGSVNKSVTDVSGTVAETLPKIITARNQMISQYDDALAIQKNADPTKTSGIMGGQVLDIPFDGTPYTKSLRETLQDKINHFSTGGMTKGIADSLQTEKDNIERGIGNGEYTLQQAMGEIGKADDKVEELNGWKDQNPGQSNLANAHIDLYKTVRAYWKQAFDQKIAEVYNSSALSPTTAGTLPQHTAISKLNDAWSSLQPLNTQLQHFDGQMQENLGSMSMPSRPGAPSTASTNFLNPGATGSWVNRIIAKAIMLNQDPQQAVNEWRSELVKTDQQGLSNAQGWLNSQGIQTSPIPRSNILGSVRSAVDDGIKSILPTRMPVQTEGPLTLSLQPPPAVPKDGFTIPRSFNVMDPQGVANLITGVAAPQDVQPLVFQWQRLVAAGDREKQAQFLGLLSDTYPDFPLARGPVTGLASEFDIGDGRPRLFTSTDKAIWEEKVNGSALSAFEKAQRVMALRKDGSVVPFGTRLSAPSQLGTSDFNFNPRQQTLTGSRRIDQ